MWKCTFQNAECGAFLIWWQNQWSETSPTS